MYFTIAKNIVKLNKHWFQKKKVKRSKSEPWGTPVERGQGAGEEANR